MKSSLVVFLKEIRENLRDKRTVINTFVTGPLIAPLIFVLAFQFDVNSMLEKAEKPLPVPVVGAANAPDLIAALKQLGMAQKPAIANPEAAVRAQNANVVLRIPADYGNAWRRGEPAQVEVIFDASQRDSDQAADRLRNMLKAVDARVASLRLLARDQSTPQSRAGIMFSMLPYFFIIGIFIGGMALAIDTTAGERERQSLEPLF